MLLDCLLEEARQTHRLTDSDSPPPGATAVGSFLGRKGGKLTLWRLAAPGVGAESAAADGAPETTSLEDVVLGYLAAGRGTAGLQLN